MIIHIDPVFKRQLRELPLDQQVEALLVCLQISAAFASPKQHSGLGLRKVHPKGYWEVRVGLGLRVVVHVEKNVAILKMIGNHDDVRRFLRSV